MVCCFQTEVHSNHNDRTSDDSISAVAKWNSLISKSLTNPFMVQKLLELVPQAKTGHSRLFKHQAVAAMRNQAAVDLECRKRLAVKTRTAHLIKENPVPSTDLEQVTCGYLNAAAKADSQTNRKALGKIVEVLDEKRPYDVGLLLTIIQLYVQGKKYDSAIDVLHKFFRYVEVEKPDHEDVRYSPGLVALAIALYRTQNRKKDIRDELGRAAAYWQSIPKNSSTTLLREAGIELLHSYKSTDLATAGAAFERLVSQDPDDKIARAGLVASFATTDYAKVEPHLSSLSSVDELTAGINVSALLDAGVPAFPAPQQASPGKKRKAVQDDGGDVAPEAVKATATTQAPQQQQQQKKKKVRLGKNYDPNVKPDPERWLPLRDRSNYRPKNKKGKKKAAESTQGGFAAGEGETLNLAGGAGQIKVEKAPQGGSGGGAGKKKKGRKN